MHLVLRLIRRRSVFLEAYVHIYIYILSFGSSAGCICALCEGFLYAPCSGALVCHACDLLAWGHRCFIACGAAPDHINGGALDWHPHFKAPLFCVIRINIVETTLQAITHFNLPKREGVSFCYGVGSSTHLTDLLQGGQAILTLSVIIVPWSSANCSRGELKGGAHSGK